MRNLLLLFTLLGIYFTGFSQQPENAVEEELKSVSFFGDLLTGCAPHTVNFTNTSTASSGIALCQWVINGDTLTNCGTVSYTFSSGGLYDITLITTANDSSVEQVTYDDYIYIMDCASLPENGFYHATVRPNPAIDVLEIVLSEQSEGFDAVLFNASGVIVRHWVLDNSVSSFSVADLAAGVYILKIRDGRGVTKALKVLKE